MTKIESCVPYCASQAPASGAEVASTSRAWKEAFASSAHCIRIRSRSGSTPLKDARPEFRQRAGNRRHRRRPSAGHAWTRSPPCLQLAPGMQQEPDAVLQLLIWLRHEPSVARTRLLFVQALFDQEAAAPSTPTAELPREAGKYLRAFEPATCTQHR